MLVMFLEGDENMHIKYFLRMMFAIKFFIIFIPLEEIQSG